MNYKANIPVYKHNNLDHQITLLLDDNIYERLESISVELDLSINVIVRSLLDHAIKHCAIEAESDDSCKNCVDYMSDDLGRYVCCNKNSKYFASFRHSGSWCVHHKRR